MKSVGILKFTESPVFFLSVVLPVALCHFGREKIKEEKREGKRRLKERRNEEIA